MNTVAIIGGGAAGMMAMATLVQEGYIGSILVFEKNMKLGAKVSISGGGRCNITTANFQKKECLPKYIRGSDRLASSYSKRSAKQTYKRFVNQGCKVKIEPDQRVFPVSDSSDDVINVFYTLAQSSSSVMLHLGETVQSLTHATMADTTSTSSQTSGPFTIITNKGQYIVDTVLLCVGGNAYRHTGSTGDGYARASNLGHTITTLGPSLNSFLSSDEWIFACSGMSFPSARISREQTNHESNQKTLTSVTGPLLFTHFGISGPLAFTLAAHIAWEMIDNDHPLTIWIAPRGERSQAERMHNLKDARTQSPKKLASTVLSQRFPKKLLDLRDTQFYAGMLEKPTGTRTKTERDDLAHSLAKGFGLTLTGRRPGDEFVTAGGVCTDEVCPGSMQSLRCQGLFFAGEILNIDGLTGGYNLQAARSTGRAAAYGILDKNRK